MAACMRSVERFAKATGMRRRISFAWERLGFGPARR